jgi:hypothetical protein
LSTSSAGEELGEKLRKAKKTAPTRFRPPAPDTLRDHKVLGCGIGMVDRAADLLTGRER